MQLYMTQTANHANFITPVFSLKPLTALCPTPLTGVPIYVLAVWNCFRFWVKKFKKKLVAPMSRRGNICTSEAGSIPSGGKALNRFLLDLIP
jgi:hypothetical protein